MKKAILLIIIALVANNAWAKKRDRNVSVQNFSEDEKYASLVVDHNTGKIIHSVNANKILHPASLTKMMTIYVTFHKIKKGKLNIREKIPVSYYAASQPRTNMGLRTGQLISVKDAINSAIIHSANDATVVLAEAIAGSEEAFSYEMNEYAQKLGMHNSNFVNASGLPDDNQVTTAYDMAKLAIALKRDFPEHFGIFSQTSFNYGGRVINSHNRVLNMYKYADGLKTGFIRMSGFNLVSTTKSPKGELVGVVMGMPTAASRDKHMVQLLTAAYKEIEPVNTFNTYQASVETDEADENAGVYRMLENPTQPLKKVKVVKKIVKTKNKKMLAKATVKNKSAAKVKNAQGKNV